MAKVTEFRDLPVDEIESRLSETREELFNLRFQNATGQLDNYKRLGELRREVARIKTVLRERELSESEGEG
jgi:large subunit ribosomal protein L29